MPNAEAQKIYDILKSSEKELYEGCKTSQLSVMAQMLSLKSDHHWSEACYDQTSQFFKGILPKDNSFLDSFYSTKKYMEELGLPSEQIDCCVNGCMLYWGEDINLEEYKLCSQGRYKVRSSRSKKEKKKVPVKRMIYFTLAPRLQRLYAPPMTATHMRWVQNECIRDLSFGPLHSVKSVPIYYVNGYKFHTQEYGADKSTFNQWSMY